MPEKDWRTLALAIAKALDADDEAKAYAVAVQVLELEDYEIAAAEAKRKESIRRRHGQVGSRLPALPGETPPRVLSHPSDTERRCSACGEVKANVTAERCSTCRQRGALHGWCGCGAALYDGRQCSQVERHLRIEARS